MNFYLISPAYYSGSLDTTQSSDMPLVRKEYLCTFFFYFFVFPSVIGILHLEYQGLTQMISPSESFSLFLCCLLVSIKFLWPSVVQQFPPNWNNPSRNPGRSRENRETLEHKQTSHVWKIWNLKKFWRSPPQGFLNNNELLGQGRGEEYWPAKVLRTHYWTCQTACQGSTSLGFHRRWGRLWLIQLSLSHLCSYK